MDSLEFGSRIVSLMENRETDPLRSIIGYTHDAYTIHYLRDDVKQMYEDHNFDHAIDELRLETLEKEYINDLFQEMHGEFECRIDVFDDAVEMNFIVDEGEGLELAVDRNYFGEQDILITDVLDTIQTYLAEK